MTKVLLIVHINYLPSGINKEQHKELQQRIYNKCMELKNHRLVFLSADKSKNVGVFSKFNPVVIEKISDSYAIQFFFAKKYLISLNPSEVLIGGQKEGACVVDMDYIVCGRYGPASATEPLLKYSFQVHGMDIPDDLDDVIKHRLNGHILKDIVL